jgi:hypothetical protein
VPPATETGTRVRDDRVTAYAPEATGLRPGVTGHARGALRGCGLAEINDAYRLGVLLTFQPERGCGRVVRAGGEALE